eukprot:CAMPEP_0197831890 /NCGR_PEP_ID=MMETSP1437-20131217/12584_1 /TAXON_ID=49252 ORGANISM="Eucampia antarctica, Strain CCMP1452" /NCGR_SAMPLE_ID=MMETSP1437 /ASSEMBLY_ACC=CAM_ASM_001096 /LENGTH=530 /DNA_ID=CAMNT_0043435009 /DNA_START=65 /DNA_END=1657 /DNA_ORIENTATION=+
MVKKKYKSKRTSLKDKYKIQRRVVETHRKARKQSKRDAANGINSNKGKKKDPGIPNSWPFKQELLQEITQAREKGDERKLLEKQNRASMKSLMAQAEKDQTQYDGSNDKDNNNNKDEELTKKDNEMCVGVGQQSKRAFFKELRKVLDASDVILQVLDARDPIGTRIHSSVENIILSHADKRMVLVLNKIDLVPKQAVAGWLSYLRKSHPAIAIKSGTNIQSGGVGQTKNSDTALQSSCGVGVESLLQLLKNYARNGGKSKSCITVGIVGYPNVGKSSILNTLKRCRAVGVSPRPGFTKSMQEVVLDRNVRLIDSPGIVFDDSQTEETVLRNCVDADSISDPIPVIASLLKKVTLQSLIMTYSIPAFPAGNVDMFLALMSKQFGKIKKGGIPDKIGTARSILRDWNTGKIPYYTPPPDPTSATDKTTRADAPSGAKIVSSFASEFNVLYSKMDAEVLQGDDDKDEMDFVQLDKDALTAASIQSNQNNPFNMDNDQDDDEDMQDDDTNNENTPTNKANKALASAEDYDFNDM